MKEKQTKKDKELKRKKPYKSPAIIHEGIISTRAGSPQLTGGSEESGVDPADLFGNGS